MLFIAIDAYAQNTSKIDSIVIKLIPWHLMPPADITCHDFENSVSYKECCISDSIVISDIIGEFSNLKNAKSKTLDVRCKMYFYSSGNIYTSACIDSKHVLYDGELYQLSPALKEIIDRTATNSKQGKLIKMVVQKDIDIPFPCGRDSLNHYLLSQSEELYKHISKPIALVVICQIDSHGKTLDVKIKNKDNTSSNDDIKRLITKLSDIFVNEIKWIPNKERYPYETVSIPLRFL